jgi:lipopolysaccharide biosynthesis glycosyltransferase
MTSAADRVVVCLTFDRNYLAPAAAVIRSCLVHTDGQAPQFEIVHDETVSRQDRQRIETMCRDAGAAVNFHLMDDHRLRGLPHADRFGSIVWWRLFLPELIDGVDRVLYLDCDTLVLSSLRPLWDEDLGARVLAAVANVVEPPMREHVAALGVDYVGGFFNAGVLLLQLDRMRDERSTDELVDYAVRHHKTLTWNDQDALNVVFKGRWHSLHPRWNAQNNLWSWRAWAIDLFGPEVVAEAVSAPAIRHFEGPSVAKPWHYLCPVPHRDAYFEMLRQTPWAGAPMQDRTASTMAIRLLPEKWRLDAYQRVVAVRSALGRTRRSAAPDRR